MKRAVKTIHPFEFNADFRPFTPPAPVESDAATMTVSVDELVQYLLQMRAEGAAEARAAFRKEEIERLEALTENMTDVLKDLVALAEHLESTAFDETFKQSTLQTITSCAKRIIDGQRDLFIDREENAANLSQDIPVDEGERKV